MKPSTDQLVDRHLRLVYFFALRILGAGEEAEDAAHDTFLKALERWDRFDYRSDGELKAWLLSICRTVVADRRRRPVLLPLDDDPVDDSTPGPGDELLEREIAGERAEAVRRALDRIDPVERELVRLKLDEGMTFEEIAGGLGATVGATKMRYYRALARLREAAA